MPDISDIEKEFIAKGGDEAFLSVQKNEFLFGLSEIKDEIKPAFQCLEIGAGSGLLSFYLSMLGCNVDAIEPMIKGFSKSGKLLSIVESKAVNPFNIFREKIEDYNTSKKYDFIFSVNAFEHLDDWRCGVVKVNEMLNAGGKAMILCSNYNFPYESHFILPILGSKEFTHKLFKGKIKNIERDNDCEGLWDSLNLIKGTEVEMFCRQKGINIHFDKNIVGRMVERLICDEEFRNRQNVLYPFAIFLLKTRLHGVFSNIPIWCHPYMKIIIEK